jgi:maltose/moltooligosaccharide transporter
MVKHLYDNRPMIALVVSGFSFIIAALLVVRVKDEDDTVVINVDE